MAKSLDDPKEVVWKLHMKFSVEKDMHLKIEGLYSFANMLTEDLMQEFSEEQHDLLQKIIFQLPNLFETFMKSALVNTGNESEHIKQRSDTLQSASLCLKSLHLMLKNIKTPKTALLLLQITLKILYQAFTHCKDSELIYGDLLENFADQLGYFFKTIEELKAATILEINHLDTVANLDTDLANISMDLGKLCELVSNFDAGRSFDLWKVYIRFLITNKDYLRQRMDVDSVLAFLATNSTDILKHYKLNLCKIDDQDEELYVKICSFQLNIIIKILEHFYGSVKESIEHLNFLVLSLYDLLVLCYSPLVLEKSTIKVMKNSVLRSIPSLVCYLSSDKLFCKSVLKMQPAAITCDLHFAFFLLKLSALPLFEDADLQLKENYFKDILSVLQANKLDDDLLLSCVQLPKVAFKKMVPLGHYNETTRIYEHACVQLSAFLKGLPDSLIQDLENTLLQHLIASSDVVSLFISDVWIYRARCSSTEFLQRQCSFIFQAYLKSDNNFHLENFLKRMLKFLPHNYKEMLLRHNEGLIEILNNDFRVHALCEMHQITSLEDPVYFNIHEQINLLMSGLKENVSSNIPDLVQRACNCLQLCSLLFNISGNTEILKFIEFAGYVFKSELYEVQNAVLSFIKTIPSNLSKDSKLEGVIVKLAELLVDTLQSKNYIVRCEAFNMFHKLAQSTYHPEIISETIRLAPHLKPAINSFITAVPVDGFLSKKEEMENLQKQILLFNEMPHSKPPKDDASILLSLASKNCL